MNERKNQYVDGIVQCLKSVEKPGDFACGGSVSLPLPALHVDGVDGILGLPIGRLEAKAVIEQCSQAPYGRGEQTIIDTAVRNTWQLNPSKVTILNPEWEQRLKCLVSHVKEELGCPSTASVACKFYKLLLYEEGGFFKPHRDTEKADGMFGTLIIQLPSQYEGGQLRVKHAGRENIFDFSGIKGCTGFHYAALYADCQHELCSVTKGYRLCLVYNLIHIGSGHCPTPVDNTVLVRRTVDAMKEWAANPSKPMIALPLDHMYCEASLSFSNLKNLDRAKADLLRMAMKEVEVDLYLCIVSITQSWSAFGCGYTAYEEEELIEQEITAKHLVSPSGKKVGNLNLECEMIKPEGALDDILDGDPDDEEVEEATGNEGATMEKWYSRAAFVLWPKQHRMDVLGLDTMANQLSKATEKYHPLSRDSAKWQKYFAVCKKLISAALTQRPNAATTAALLSSAAVLQEYSLVSELLGSTSTSTNLPTVPASRHLNSWKFVDAVILSCSTFGWKCLQPCLKGLMEAGAACDVESCVQFLYRLVSSQPSLSPDLLLMGQELSLPVCKVLVEEQDIAPKRPSSSWYWQPCQPSSRSHDFVCNLLKTLSLLEYSTQLEQVLQCFVSRCNRYPLDTVLLPAVEEFHQWLGKKSDALLAFAAHCVTLLEVSTKVPIEEPSDWSQNITISCRCEDCTDLQSFCKHPTRTSARYKVKESRRKHLEQQMRANECDCSHMTEYSGIPRTLVVTKTRKRFERKKQERKTKLLMLSRMRALHEANNTEPSAKRPCFIDLTDEP